MKYIPDSFLKCAEHYAIEQNWRVSPAHSVNDGKCTCPKGANCKQPGKHPRLKSWQKIATTNLPDIEKWARQYPDTNIHIATGAASLIFVVDIDPKDDGDKTLRQLEQKYGPLPKTLTVRTGGGGTHYYFTYPSNTIIRNSQSKLGELSAPGIDIRGEGGCAIAPPSMHVSGKCYQWHEERAPWNLSIAEAPHWLIELIANHTRPRTPPEPNEIFGANDNQILELANDAIAILDPDMPRDEWIKILMALKSTGCGEEAFSVADEWSKKGDKYDSATIRYQWDSLVENGNGYSQITIRTLFYMAKEHGWKFPDWYMDRVLDRGDPQKNAQMIIKEYFTSTHGKVKLVFLDRFFYQPHPYENRYRKLENDELRSLCYEFLSDGTALVSGKLVPFKPKRRDVDELIDALKALQHPWLLRDSVYRGDLAPPFWLDAKKAREYPPEEILPVNNGLLHWPSEDLIPRTPDFFNLHSADFAYQAGGRTDRWQTFLQSIWREDPESIEALQEIMGYLIFADNRYQKIFLIIGPPRSGKGTIATILRYLIGINGVAGTTLSSLSEQFGLSNLINKKLAVISDARFKASGSKQAIVAERLLSISGNDMLSIDRKHRSVTDTVLPTRFLILSNELPQLIDSSTALAKRFIILRMTQSFFNEEDQHLLEKLCNELPGILDWSLLGWNRLVQRGRFQAPTSAATLSDELKEMSSPINSFIEEHCVVCPKHTVSVANLFKAWECWCSNDNREPGSKSTFGQKLRSVIPNLERIKPTINGKRNPYYQGVGLRPPYPAGFLAAPEEAKRPDVFTELEREGFFGLREEAQSTYCPTVVHESKGRMD